MIYDGYRSHLTLKALETLRNRNVIVCWLPARNSGKSKPLDVELYGPFKAALNEEISRETQLYDDPSFEQFDLLSTTNRAYESTITSLKVIG